MTRDQKTVIAGALSGIVLMLLATAILTLVLPSPMDAHTVGGRLGYALPWLALTALPLFFMIAAVGNARFGGAAIDPTLGVEDAKTIVNGRVADNTTQQLLLFVAGALALSVTVPDPYVQAVGAAAIVFTIARMAFWIGYRIRPLYRAPGFAATAYLNLGLLISSLAFALF